MALEITLTPSGGGPAISIEADVVTLTISRMPAQPPLPGQVIAILDLDVQIREISVQGTAQITSPDSATRTQLETAGMTYGALGLSTLIESAGNSYTGYIKSLSLVRRSESPDIYDLTLIFAVQAKL